MLTCFPVRAAVEKLLRLVFWLKSLTAKKARIMLRAANVLPVRK